jgi:hypothetical protein
MRILSVTILLAALFGLPAAVGFAHEYSDPSVATPLHDGGYYAQPQPAVTEEFAPGDAAPGKPPKRNGNENGVSPSDAAPVRPPMPPMDPVQKGSIVDRLESAEKQLDALQHQVMSGKGSTCEVCCDKSMTYAGLEIVALKVFQSEGLYGNNDYQPGVRIWAGIQRDDGLGLRIRWFDYTQSIAGDVVDIENLDLELTDAFDAGCWQGVVSGGFRYSEVSESVVIVGGPATGTDTFASGLTVGLQLNRYLTDRASIFASVQESILYGNDIGIAADDIVFSITELQLGVQLDRNMYGSTAFFRTGVEAQLYSAVSGTDSEDLGLFGIFATVGVMR